MAGEAVSAFERAAALSGARDLAHLAYAHAVTGRRSEAERIVQTLLDPSAYSYLPPFHMAVAYVGLGHADEAFRWLEQGCTEHASYMNELKAMPYFAPLHGDPRWVEILRRIDLER